MSDLCASAEPELGGHGYGTASSPILGCLPPLASVTAVRVVNFTTYNWTKDAISDVFKRVTGVSPVEEYNKPGSTPTLTGLFTFTTAGMVAGLVTSPLACESFLALKSTGSAAADLGSQLDRPL